MAMKKGLKKTINTCLAGFGILGAIVVFHEVDKEYNATVAENNQLKDIIRSMAKMNGDILEVLKDDTSTGDKIREAKIYKDNNTGMVFKVHGGYNPENHIKVGS